MRRLIESLTCWPQLDGRHTLIDNCAVDIRLKSKSRAHLAIALLALLGALLLIVLSLDLRAAPAVPITEVNTLAGRVQFSPPSGYYERALSIRITSPDPDAAIYFTTDGSVPTPENGTLYTTPIQIPDDQPRVHTIRARPVLPDGDLGDVQSATYFINIETDIPLLSLIVDPDDLWSEESGIFASPHKRGREWEREAEMFYYDPQEREGVHAPAGVRVHGVGSRAYDKKSMRLYFRDEYGLPALEFPLFPDADIERFEELVIHDGGQDFPAVSANGTLLRNQVAGNLAREAGGYATYTRPTLLFLNGQLWGIYNIRERISDRYLAQEFQIEDADLLGGFENSLRASSGDRDHWLHLMEYLKANDLTDEENYAHVQTQMNLDNFINYVAIQIITANADWPHNNQNKFRDRDNGRWHWMFWDSDYTFGLISVIYIDKDMYERALDPEGERGQLSSMLLNKLLANPEFKNKFLARLADLLNTVFTSENMLAEIDRHAAALEGDISYETRRWPGSGDWDASVEYMREFARQRPEQLRSETIETFDLPGTAQLTINPPDSGKGSVSINGGSPLPNHDLPWEGTYFQEVAITLTAIPDPGYQFAGWQPAELAQTPELTLPVSGDLTITPSFVRSEGENAALAGSVNFSGYGRDGTLAPEEGLEGDWITLQVRAPGGVDLRGWRITDNDSLTARDEGSLILPDNPALANLPLGTTILLVTTETPHNDRLFAEDDLSPMNGRLLLYAGNNNLDTKSDPWFAIGENDTLVLLAPGASAAFADDLAVDFLVIGEGSTAVTPADFGR